jgi:hypothetical protein
MAVNIHPWEAVCLVGRPADRRLVARAWTDAEPPEGVTRLESIVELATAQMTSDLSASERTATRREM